MLTSSNEWNPYEIKFPRLSETEVGEIEGRNVSAVEFDSRREMDTRYDESHHKPMRIFDIQAFNA